jgi:hypothetical protein
MINLLKSYLSEEKSKGSIYKIFLSPNKKFKSIPAAQAPMESF